MGRLTFRTRLSVWFCLILGLSLFSAGVVFGIAYFGVSIYNLQKFMLRENQEIYEKHFVISNSEIFFTRDGQGKTLSGYLRDEGLSALVLGKDKKTIAAYGVYAGLKTEGGADLYEKDALEQVGLTLRQKFKLVKLYGGRLYMVLASPVVKGDQLVGYLVLASDMDQARQMLVFSLMLLALIIPVSLIIGWWATRLLVEKLFSPLERLLMKMKDVSVGDLAGKIRVAGNPKDELVRLANRYNEMLDRLDEGIAKQKEFAIKVSHELKTPLTQAILNLDLVDGNSRKVETIKGQLRHFGDLIDSLLTLARIKTGRVENRKVQVGVLAGKIIAQYRRERERNKQEVKILVGEKCAFWFTEVQWRMIFANLLSNAIKYGKVGGVITVRIGARDGIGYLAVENQGQALAAGESKKIWQKFYRGNNSKTDGLGLGLAIVREVAEANGLEIKTGMGVKEGHFVEISGFEVV